MAWQTPKTDWTSADGVTDADLNRIEGNINYIEKESRTPNQNATPGGSGMLQTILNYIVTQIKKITGATNWYDTPATTLAAAKSHMDSTSNPHNVTATQVGALVSVDGVSNAGGNVDLVAGSNISIAPDDTNNRITIGGTGTWPNADKLDGYHAGSFVLTSDYEDTDVLNKIKNVDGAGSGLDADKLDGKQSGNASGNIPVSNGTVCTNLNADKLDGYHIQKNGTDGAGIINFKTT